jgi:hypothetical protein
MLGGLFKSLFPARDDAEQLVRARLDAWDPGTRDAHRARVRSLRRAYAGATRIAIAVANPLRTGTRPTNRTPPYQPFA